MAIQDDAAVLGFRRAQVRYERRLVAFYDVLGWRDKIQQAGVDPVALARLRNVVSFYTLIARKEKQHNDLRISTFSDNVVMSISPDKKDFIILLLGLIQIVGATSGCLLRGGMTVGNIAHDDDVVFGPALNRAYDIERTISAYPRIVADPEQVQEFANAIPLLRWDKDVATVDPFRRAEFDLLCRMTTRWRMDRGEIVPGNLEREFAKEVMDTFSNMFHALTDELQRPLPEAAWKKVAWLFDRIATDFGIPERASDYRQVR